jgi:hypothetical protein
MSRSHVPAGIPGGEVLVSAHAAPIQANLRQRRHALSERALSVTAEALSSGHLVAWQNVPRLACDRTPRYREAQLLGERALPLEDLPAMAQESVEGRVVALAMLRSLLAQLEPAERQADLGSSGAALAREGAEALGEILISIRDSHVDANEAARIREAVGDVIGVCNEILSAVAQPWRPEVARRIEIHQGRKEGERG